MNTYRVTVVRTRTEVYEVHATSHDEAAQTFALGRLVDVEIDTEVASTQQVTP